MNQTVVLAIVLLAFLSSSAAFANGGPVQWTRGTPLGGVMPRDVEGVRLVAEELFINLDDDLTAPRSSLQSLRHNGHYDQETAEDEGCIEQVPVAQFPGQPPRETEG